MCQNDKHATELFFALQNAQSPVLADSCGSTASLLCAVTAESLCPVTDISSSYNSCDHLPSSDYLIEFLGTYFCYRPFKTAAAAVHFQWALLQHNEHATQFLLLSPAGRVYFWPYSFKSNDLVLLLLPSRLGSMSCFLFVSMVWSLFHSLICSGDIEVNSNTGEDTQTILK